MAGTSLRRIRLDCLGMLHNYLKVIADGSTTDEKVVHALDGDDENASLIQKLP